MWGKAQFSLCCGMEKAWAAALSLQNMSFFPKVGQNLGTLIPCWLMPKEAVGVLFGVIQQEKQANFTI